MTEIHAFAHTWNDGLPRWHSGKESICQCRRHKRCRFNSWVLTIPCRRKWQPASVFLPGKFRDRGVWRVTMGPQRVRHNWARTRTRARAHTHTHTHTLELWVARFLSQNDHAFLLLEKHAQLLKCTQGSFHYLLHKELCDNHTLTFFSKLFSHSIQSMKFSRPEYWSG